MKLRTLFATLFVLFSMVLIDTSWNYYLELHERESARKVLHKVKRCVADDASGGIIDRLEQCASGVKTTPTGDIFAYNLKTKQMLFDPSVDCRVEGGTFMTEDSICAIHNGTKQCNVALEAMDKGYNSSPDQRVWWDFDGSPEWLEWVIYPSEMKGIFGHIRGGNFEAEQVVIAIGIQEDELGREFLPFRLILIFLGLTAILVTLTLSIYDRKVT